MWVVKGAHWENFPTLICIHTPCSGLWLVMGGVAHSNGNHSPERSWAQPEVTSPEPEVTWLDPEMTSPEPEVTWFKRENRWPVGKIDRGLRMGQNRWENAGAKSKVQVGLRGWSLSQRKGVYVGKNILMADMFEQLNKSLNEDPRSFAIIHFRERKQMPEGGV